MPFCSNCGKEITDGSPFCSGCGQAVGGQTAQPPRAAYQQPYPQPICQNPLNLLQQLSSKIKTNAVIWIVIACVQFVIGIVNIAAGIALNADYEDGTTNLVMGMFVIVVGIMNIVNASKNFKYSGQVLIKPVGIVKNFQPLGNLVGTLIYNLLFGGVIGIAGSIYAFILRNFVLSNMAQFQAIEAEFMNGTASPVHN